MGSLTRVRSRNARQERERCAPYMPIGPPIIKAPLDAGCPVAHAAKPQRAPNRGFLHRPVALDGHPVSGTGMRPVVPHRVVLDAAIVPEGDRVLAPAEAALEQRIGHVLVKITQHAVALVAWNAENAPGKALVDVKRLLAGHRVRAYDRVLGARIARLVGDPIICVLAAIVLAVVDRG